MFIYLFIENYIYFLYISSLYFAKTQMSVYKFVQQDIFIVNYIKNYLHMENIHYWRKVYFYKVWFLNNQTDVKKRFIRHHLH